MITRGLLAVFRASAAIFTDVGSARERGGGGQGGGQLQGAMGKTEPRKGWGLTNIICSTGHANRLQD